MKIERFEEIEAWKEARKLVKDIYCGFSKCRDFAFKGQIQRAGISIMSNIAEGFERNTNKEFINFLSISRGSLAEVKSLLYAANDIGYIDKSLFDQLFARVLAVNGLLNGFISYLKNHIKRK